MNFSRFKMIVFVFCVVASNFVVNAGVFGKTVATIGDGVSLGVKVGKGVAVKAPELIPTIDDLYNFGKQNLLGLPFEVAIEILDKICSIAMAGNNNATKPKNSKQANISEMNYVLVTDSENITIPITESGRLWTHSLFDNAQKVVILVTGWTTNPDEYNDTADLLYRAYRSRGQYNFVLIDTAKYVDTLYAWAAFNSQELGEGLGKGLTDLIEYVPVENIHLIGTSLGSHIVGAAGRAFYEATNGKLLPRITGLDPAKPCFNEGEFLTGLGRGDAEFVDIIHSNSGALGKKEPIGDVDFYPNGIVPLMPGCLDIVCSHIRAWEYYAESVYPGNENNFIAKKCGSLSSYEINACIRKEIPMGYATPTDAKGNYFLKTNGKEPFGKKN